jgi:hypothetical protein
VAEVLLRRAGAVFDIALDDGAEGVFPGWQVSMHGDGLIAVYFIVKIFVLLLAAIRRIGTANAIGGLRGA